MMFRGPYDREFEREQEMEHEAYRRGASNILDKVRAEIADLDDADYDYEGYYKAVTDALEIIDRFRNEVSK